MSIEKTIRKIYGEYKSHSGEFFNRYKYIKQIPDNGQFYKDEILTLLTEAINNKDVPLLHFCICAAFQDGIDADYSNLFHSVLLSQWHNEQEDIVQIIDFYLKDDVFTDALLEIALQPEIYRKFDDENESTLRKCVHALVAIASPKAKLAIERLVKLNNPNVEFALGMYK